MPRNVNDQRGGSWRRETKRCDRCEAHEELEEGSGKREGVCVCVKGCWCGGWVMGWGLNSAGRGVGACVHPRLGGCCGGLFANRKKIVSFWDIKNARASPAAVSPVVANVSASTLRCSTARSLLGGSLEAYRCAIDQRAGWFPAGSRGWVSAWNGMLQGKCTWPSNGSFAVFN